MSYTDTRALAVALYEELRWLLTAEVTVTALGCIHVTVDPSPLTDAEEMALAQTIYRWKAALDNTAGQRSRVIAGDGRPAETVRWDDGRGPQEPR